MSIRTKVSAAFATLTLIGSVGLAGALTAGPAAAGTPSCGPSCLNVWNQDPGLARNFVVDVFRQGRASGQPLILFRTSNYDPAEDWGVAFQGTVADFFVAGLVNAATALHYGCNALATGFSDCAPPLNRSVGFPNLFAFEVEYSPFGVASGLCAGVASTAFQGEGVTLQPCGVSSKTVWILDTLDPSANSFPGELPGYVPLINGSNTNFSHPFVLTYPTGKSPTDKPRPQLEVTNLTGFAAPGNGGVLPEISTVSSAQLWSGRLGVNP